MKAAGLTAVFGSVLALMAAVVNGLGKDQLRFSLQLCERAGKGLAQGTTVVTGMMRATHWPPQA